jgi:hypothetical protein
VGSSLIANLHSHIRMPVPRDVPVLVSAMARPARLVCPTNHLVLFEIIASSGGFKGAYQESKMARMLKTGPRQIGQAVPTNRGASSTHKQRWPHGLTAIVGRCSKHTTHSDSGWEVIVDASLSRCNCL